MPRLRRARAYEFSGSSRLLPAGGALMRITPAEPMPIPNIITFTTRLSPLLAFVDASHKNTNCFKDFVAIRTQHNNLAFAHFAGRNRESRKSAFGQIAT